jgi:5-hydroxyisourate hydrolase-like protein (transthyretin family)
MHRPVSLLCRILIATAASVFTLTYASAQTRDAKAKATGSISGRVTIGGKAAEGIPVAAFGGENADRRVAAAKALTDADGRYHLSGLAPGQYQIAPLTPNLTSAQPESFPSYGLPYFASSKNIILGANEIVEDIDVKLVRGGVITGRVTDSDNKPLVEARVSLQPIADAQNPVRPPIPFNNQMYLTDDRGIYRIYGLPAGRYTVSVGSATTGGIVAPNNRRYYQRTFYPDVTEEAKASIVELTEGGEATNVDIKVGSPADAYSVTGHVIDSETGLPLSGLRIGFLTLRPNQERPSTFYSGLTSDNRGEFKLDGFAPGHYGAYVSSDYDGGDFYSNAAYFEIVDKDVTGVELKAIRGLSLSGVVMVNGDVTKEILSQLAVLRVSASVIPTSSAQITGSASAQVGPDGSFQINGLRPGRISIGVYPNGPSLTRPTIERIEHDGIGVSQGFEIQPGQSISGLRVVVNYGTGTIRGTVSFEGGNLPVDARTFVSCRREGARDGGGSQVDSRGHFLISNLAPGTYDVMLQLALPRTPRPIQPQKQVVTVTADSESAVTFVINLAPKEGGP